MNPSDNSNSGGGFFSQRSGVPKNLGVEEQDNDKATDIRKRNLDYMVDIRKKNRKNLIRNNRFQNVMRVTGQDQPQMAPENNMAMITLDQMNSPFPVHLSHLDKVEDSQRIFKIINDMQDKEVDQSNLKEYLEAVKSEDRIQRHKAIIYLRRSLSNRDNLPIQNIIDLNGVPLLMDIAKDTSELHMRLEATWCLANLVSGTSEQTATMISKDIIGLFIGILDDQYSQIVEQAIWGLGNIIGDCVHFREKVVKNKVLPKLIKLLQKFDNMSIVKNIIWCLSNACRIKPNKEQYTAMKEPVVSMIKAFIVYDDVTIKTDCLLGFSEYCKKNLISHFLEEGFLLNLRKFYQYLYSTDVPYENVQAELSAVHKIIGNITNGDDFDTGKIINQNFLKDLNVTMKIDNALCKREICWILSNIAAGTSGQINALINEPGLFASLVTLLYGVEKNIQREALWTICNMTKNCNRVQLDFLINQQILNVFNDLIGMDKDSKMIVLVLEAIPNIIEKFTESNENAESNKEVIVDMMFDCGLADKISELQKHQSDHIYERALTILESHFDLEEY